MRRFSFFPQRREGSYSSRTNHHTSDAPQHSWQTLIFSAFEDSSFTTTAKLPQQFLTGRNPWRDPHFAVVLFIVAILLLLFWKLLAHWHCRQTWSKKCGVPVLWHTPQGISWPWLGQAIQFLRYRPWDLMSSWHTQYGPIVCFPLLGNLMFSVGSPHLLKQVWQSKIASVKKDVHNVMKPFLVLLGTGIVTSEDELWMKQRLKMSHPLRHEVLEMIPSQTLLAVQRLMHQWDTKACDDTQSQQQSVAVGSALRHLTLQVISGTFLSLSADESDSTFAKLYLPIVDESNARVWHPYRSYLICAPSFWYQLWNVHRLNAYVSQLIRERWRLRRREQQQQQTAATQSSNHSSNNPPQNLRQADILDGMLRSCEKELLLGSSNSSSSAEQPLDVGSNHRHLPLELPESHVKQLRDELKTFMLAGHETSAAMMTWALYELLGNDALMLQVAQEALAVFGTCLPDALRGTRHDLPKERLSELVLSEATLKVRGQYLSARRRRWTGVSLLALVVVGSKVRFLTCRLIRSLWFHRKLCESE